MTIDDRIRTSLAAHAELPNELPGLYGAVSARARIVRRRRRVVASVASCVAVVAIAVPFALNGFGEQTPRPNSPTPPPSESHTPAPQVTVRPSPPQSLAPAPATTTERRVDPPIRPAAPAAPAPLFPAGPVPNAPLLISNGTQMALQQDGQAVPIGPYGKNGFGLQTSYGVLILTGPGLVLVTREHHVVVLPGTKGIGGGCGVGVLSPDGRYLAWGKQDLTHYTANSGTPPGWYGLYDLKDQRILDRVASKREGCPEGFLDDGRVAAGTGDGGDSGSAIWDPASATVTEVTKANVTAILPNHHKLAVTFGGEAGCLNVPARWGDPQHYLDCLNFATLSPDGKRRLDLVTVTDVGKTVLDTRLPVLLKSKHLYAMDSQWLDNDHVVVLASNNPESINPGDRWTYQRVLTCSLPVGGQPSCTESQPVGPVWRDAQGANANVLVGPVASLVRRG